MANTVQRVSGERGAMLALASFFLVAFIGCAAFCIDLALGIASRQQSENYARLASLAAIEAYFQDDGTVAEKLAAAEAAANAVAAQNFILSNPSDDSNEIGTDVGFQPGTWYFDEAEEGVDPCVSGESLPCFVPADPSDATQADRINAFYISGSLYDRISTKFARIFRAEEVFQTQIEAIATVIPRHGCFLIDLSPSMAALTHQASPNFTATPSKFAMLWDTVEDEPVTSAGDRIWNGVPAASPTPVPGMAPTRGANPYAAFVHYKDDYELKQPYSDANYSGGTHPLHPAPTDKNGKYSSNTIATDFKVDTWRNPGTYDGPEPLMTVIAGVKFAVDKFKERRVAGDKLCVVFYDHRMPWMRVVNLTGNFDDVSTFLDFSGNPPPEKMFNHAVFPAETTFTNSLMAIAEALQQFSSPAASGVPAANFITIISDGLHNCTACPFGGFVSSSGDFDGNGCVGISDFACVNSCVNDPPTPAAHCTKMHLGNGCQELDLNGNGLVGPTGFWLDCSEDEIPNGSPETQSEYCGDRPQVPATTDSDMELWLVQYTTPGDYCSTCLRKCSHTSQQYRDAIEELKRIISLRVVPSGIPIHVILTGDHVAPHTVDLADPSTAGRCLTDEEVRALPAPQPQFVRGGNYWGNGANGYQFKYGCNNNPPTNPKCCLDNGSPVHDCAFATMGPVELDPDSSYGVLTTPWYDANYDWYEVASGTGGLWAPLRPPDSGCVCEGSRCFPDVDDALCDPTKARRILDPYCRTYEQQIEDTMLAIIGVNPYTLVELR